MEVMKYTRRSLNILTRVVNGLYRVEMENLTLKHLIWIIDGNLKLSRLRAANVVMLMMLEGCALRYKLRIAWNLES